MKDKQFDNQWDSDKNYIRDYMEKRLRSAIDPQYRHPYYRFKRSALIGGRNIEYYCNYIRVIQDDLPLILN